MKPFRWNHDKNTLLKHERNISFEEIVLAIDAGGLLDVLRHTNIEKYPNQQVFVITFADYVYLIPFVEADSFYSLKTIIPSRKAKRDYLAKD